MLLAIRLAATLLPILYGCVSLAYVLIFFRDDPAARRLAPRALVTTVAVHSVYMALLAVHLGRVPIATSFESLSALALAIAIVYLVQEHRSRTPYTGLIFVPLVFLCQTLASALADPQVQVKHEVLRSPLFGVHISAALLGYAAFAVAAIYGLLYVLLYHELKRDRFGIVYQRLPELEVLSAMNLRAATFGFICLTAAIGFGAVWSERVDPKLLQVAPDFHFWKDPKVWLSFLAWVIYALCLLVRYVVGWQGKRIAYFTIAGFLFIVFSMLAANRLFTTFHDFINRAS